MKANMSKNTLITEYETSKSFAVYRETWRQRPVTLQIPSGLDSIGVQEWHRLVAERTGHPDGMLPGDVLYLKAAAWIFSRIVRMRQRLPALQARRINAIYFRPYQRAYIGLCHSLNCTPALPNRQESP
jgi:hypothetical protein